MEARPATKVVEKELARWAFGPHSMVAYLVPWLTDARPHLVAFEVREPVLMPSDRQSDELDVLLWPAGDPANAIAIEVKRLRVDGTTLATEQIGGLPGLREGANQVNGHVRRGFSRVYLAVFVQVDGRTFSGGYWTGGGLPSAFRRRIIDEIGSAIADSGIGVLLVELNQPVDKDVLLGGGLSLLYSRIAASRTQPVGLTDRVRRFADSPPHVTG